MEKTKVSEVKLLFALVVIMSLFNLVSVQYYFFDYGHEGDKKVVSEVVPSVPQKTAEAAVKTPAQKDAKTSTVYNSLKHLFGGGTVQDSSGQTVANSDNFDSSTQTSNTDNQNSNTQQNSDTTNSNPSSTPTSNTDTQSSNTQQNNNQQPTNANGNSNNQNNQNGAGNQQQTDDSSSPLNDDVPPNDSGPQAQSVEGQNLQFHFGTGVQQ